jgi:hypothetical protein
MLVPSGRVGSFGEKEKYKGWKVSLSKKITIPMTDETRLALLEHTNITISDTLKEIKIELKEIRSDLKLYKTEINQRFEKTNQRSEDNFINLNNKIDSLNEKTNQKVDSNFKWIMNVMLILFAGLYVTSISQVVMRLFHIG